MSGQLILSDDVIRKMLEQRAAEAPVGALLADITSEVWRTPQTSDVGGGNLRWFGQLALAASLAAIVVFAVVILEPGAPRGPGVGGTDPATAAPGTASPSASAAVRTMVSVGIDGPVMEGGDWRTLTFEHPFRFSVADALWVPGADLPRQFYLRARLPGAPRDEFDAVTLVSIQNVYVGPCEQGEDAGTDPWDPSAGPQAFFDWLEESSPVDFGMPRPATVLGRQGLELEFTMPDLSACAFGFMPITDVGRPTSFATGFPGQLTRYAVTTVNGQTVLVVTWTDDPGRWEAVKSAADELLATIEFLE